MGRDVVPTRCRRFEGSNSYGRAMVQPYRSRYCVNQMSTGKIANRSRRNKDADEGRLLSIFGIFHIWFMWLSILWRLKIPLRSCLQPGAPRKMKTMATTRTNLLSQKNVAFLAGDHRSLYVLENRQNHIAFLDPDIEFDLAFLKWSPIMDNRKGWFDLKT